MAKIKLHGRLSRLLSYGLVLVLAVPLVMTYFFPAAATAAELNNRSVTIVNPEPGATTTHTFQFDINTAAILGSVKFLYCSNSPFINLPCTAPTGLSLLAANLSSQTGQTGFNISGASTANEIILSRPPILANSGTVSFVFDNVVNPTLTDQAIYVRVSTYISADASGPLTDNGSVAFDLSTGIAIGGFVPPRLVLCVGDIVAVDCSSQSGQISDFGILSASATRSVTTQFSVATNDVDGYNVYLLGTPLTSGNDVIPATASPQPSLKGTSQFGLNLVANSSPPVGTDPVGSGTGVISSGYNQPNQYMFQSGDQLVSSSLSSDFNLFTVSYIANINTAQPLGVYSTTITYLGIVDF